MKKIFLPKFEPPRLVMGTDRWYISFYAIDDITGKRKKFRPTFNLNRIKEEVTRKARGDELVKKVTWWLEQGHPVSMFREDRVPELAFAELASEQLYETNVIEAIEYILKLKEKTTRCDTMRSYRSTAKHFVLHLKKRRWSNLPVAAINRRHAGSYMDSCLVERELGAYAYNNNLRYMRAIFNELKRKGYTDATPFSEVMFMKKTEKQRRNFTQEEARLVIRRIRQESELLFYALLLEYSCFMRPSEIRQLTGKDIDIEHGVVVVPSSKAKTKKTRYVTIPQDFLPYFDLDFFKRIGKNMYVFGEGFNPGRRKPVTKNTMGRMHKRILEQMKKEGLLDDITGLQWYSWKDTGITDALDNVAILAVQDQAGHHSPEMTLRYRHKKKINYKIRDGFKNKLL